MGYRVVVVNGKFGVEEFWTTSRGCEAFRLVDVFERSAIAHIEAGRLRRLAAGRAA